MKKKVYEGIMMGLAVVVLIMLIIELSLPTDEKILEIFGYVDNGILIIFAIDYFYRLYKAEQKWKFFKENIFDLIAIIPFNSIFMLARLTRLVRLLKLLKLLKLVSYAGRFFKRFEKFFKTNNFIYVLLITIILIVLGSLFISSAEGMSFSDSIWWSFVTATTVGYGDISPKTSEGRVVAVFLMISGIGFIGMLTGTISTYFIKNSQERKCLKVEIIDNIKQKLDDFESLSIEEIDEIHEVLSALKSRKTGNKADELLLQKNIDIDSSADDKLLT